MAGVGGGGGTLGGNCARTWWGNEEKQATQSTVSMQNICIRWPGWRKSWRRDARGSKSYRAHVQRGTKMLHGPFDNRTSHRSNSRFAAFSGRFRPLSLAESSRFYAPPFAAFFVSLFLFLYQPILSNLSLREKWLSSILVITIARERARNENQPLERKDKSIHTLCPRIERKFLLCSVTRWKRMLYSSSSKYSLTLLVTYIYIFKN